jgi:hypothetical protein
MNTFVFTFQMEQQEERLPNAVVRTTSLVSITGKAKTLEEALGGAMLKLRKNKGMIINWVAVELEAQGDIDVTNVESMQRLEQV